MRRRAAARRCACQAPHQVSQAAQHSGCSMSELHMFVHGGAKQLQRTPAGHQEPPTLATVPAQVPLPCLRPSSWPAGAQRMPRGRLHCPAAGLRCAVRADPLQALLWEMPGLEVVRRVDAGTRGAPVQQGACQASARHLQADTSLVMVRQPCMCMQTQGCMTNFRPGAVDLSVRMRR